MRLRQLGNWIDTWDDVALNAGVPGKSATDAWHTTALDIETAQMSSFALAGGSLDIYKCFDQLNRTLIFKLAEVAGMPKPILTAYRAFVVGMRSRFQYGSNIGKPYSPPTSIPQGCPFSMTMVALLMRPWLFLMRGMAAEPRCLADDLLILCVGAHHEQRYVDAMTASRK